MDENPLERMRELRKENKEIYDEMGKVGSGHAAADD